MGGNYFVDKRRADKQRLLDMTKKNPELMDNETKLIAVFSMQTGYRRETIKEMLDELKDAELV